MDIPSSKQKGKKKSTVLRVSRTSLSITMYKGQVVQRVPRVRTMNAIIFYRL